MASFKDYSNKDNKDSIQKEIEDAGKQSGDRKTELPDRFKGKSAEQIAESYVNLEGKFNERNDSMGALRKQVDELVALETVRQATPDKEQEVKPVTVDDFYENPEATIAKVAERTSSKKIEDLERKIASATAETALDKFNSLYPDAIKDADTDEFKSWLHESNYRLRMAQQADKYDFDAAKDLFQMYYETRGDTANTQEDIRKKQIRDKQLHDAELETGGAADAFDTDSKFSRLDIITKKIASKRGNSNATMWLKANQDAIAIAYAEGNITD